MIANRPRGTNDFLPGETEKWQYVENLLRELCREFGYQEIRTPIFEETQLFQRGVGDTTDIVQKEMYTFNDMGQRSITLRPENTASVVRAYIENKLYGALQPVKLYYMGPMFRYERPQAGRYRQFHQFGVECFGAASPEADAEVIALAWEFYHRLGLKNLQLHLNSVGCPNCRPAHRKALQDFLWPHLSELCPTCQSRFEKNPMRILDCKSPVCQAITKDVPTTIDCLCDDCRDNFEAVCRYLDAAGIKYAINYCLVRGLDYYTNTAFEIIMEEIGAQSAICGGGRYNGLMQELGGTPTPGVGFALGMERIFAALAAQNIEVPIETGRDVFVAAIDETADLAAFSFLMQLRKMGIKAEKDILGRSLKAQMKYADKFKVKYTVLLGGAELAAGQVILRNMATSEQQPIALSDAVEFLVKEIK